MNRRSFVTSLSSFAAAIPLLGKSVSAQTTSTPEEYPFCEDWSVEKESENHNFNTAKFASAKAGHTIVEYSNGTVGSGYNSSYAAVGNSDSTVRSITHGTFEISKENGGLRLRTRENGRFVGSDYIYSMPVRDLEHLKAVRDRRLIEIAIIDRVMERDFTGPEIPLDSREIEKQLSSVRKESIKELWDVLLGKPKPLQS